jgi:hypothetical protein
VSALTDFFDNKIGDHTRGMTSFGFFLLIFFYPTLF